MDSEQISDVNEPYDEIDNRDEPKQQEIKEKVHEDNLSLKSEDIRRREAIVKCEKRKKKIRNCCSIPSCVLIRILLIFIVLASGADMVCLRNDGIYWLVALPAVLIILECIWLVWKRKVI